MADEPLDSRISREIRERLKESRAVVLEYERLEAALQALDKLDGATTTKTRPHRRGNRSTQTRAPQGANREKALAAIQDHPGISVAELSAATGITKNVLYGLMRTLTERGLVERVDGADGAVGFRIATPADAGTEASEATAVGAATPAGAKGPKLRRRSASKAQEAAADASSASETLAAEIEESAETA